MSYSYADQNNSFYRRNFFSQFITDKLKLNKIMFDKVKSETDF